MSKIDELRKQISKVLHHEDTPYAIALGAAIGIFWNFIPSLGIGPLLCILVAKLLKARAVVAVTVNIATGFFIPLFYSLNVITGRIFTGLTVDIGEIEGNLGNSAEQLVQNIDTVIQQPISLLLMDKIQSVSMDFIIGCLFNSFFAATLTYTVLWFILKNRKKYKKNTELQNTNEA